MWKQGGLQWGHLFSTFLIALCAVSGRPFVEQSSGAQNPSEYQVKAAFLLNFTKFVDWPPALVSDPNGAFRICILGDDPFGPVLDQMVEGEKVSNHRVTVERMRAIPTSGCQVLFVSSSEKNIPDILGTVRPGVLTVGEKDAFVREGGIVGFVLDHRRVRFDINQSAAAKASLKLSSKLLSVARTVAN